MRSGMEPGSSWADRGFPGKIRVFCEFFRVRAKAPHDRAAARNAAASLRTAASISCGV